MRFRIKRWVDIIFALLLLVLFWPLMVLVSLAVIVESGWPPIFIQERAGLRGKPFRIFKFRTMLRKSLFYAGDEQRITRLGRFLRSTSMDELPQLFNVLRGDMSLVGPRPTLPYQVERYTHEQSKRLAVLPGMTGWAQVNRGELLSWEERINHDIWYIENHSVWLDFRILVMTLGVVFRRRRAWVNQSTDRIASLPGGSENKTRGEEQ